MFDDNKVFRYLNYVDQIQEQRRAVTVAVTNRIIKKELPKFLLHSKG